MSDLVIDDLATLTEPRLVARAQRGDRCAIELIMRRHNRLLFRVALSIVKDPWEAEEVLQDSYLRAFTRLHEFVGPSGFRSWLVRIAVNEALQRLRRRRGQPVAEAAVAIDEVAEDMDDALTAGPNPEQLAAAGETRRVLETAVRALPAPFRTVFVLRAVERMSVLEVAESLGIPPATVKTRFHRANALLRRALRAHAEAALPELFPFGGERCDRVVAVVLERLRLADGAGESPHPPGGERGPVRG